MGMEKGSDAEKHISTIKEALQLDFPQLHQAPQSGVAAKARWRCLQWLVDRICVRNGGV